MAYKKRGLKAFTSKRGMDIDLWFNVFELVIVFVVVLVLWDFVNGEMNNTAYEKIYFSRDSAFLLNTIYGSPGDIQYNYQEKPKNFIFDFNQNKVSVYEQYESVEGGIVDYYFAEDKNYNIFYTKLMPKPDAKIKYSKAGKNIEISN